MLKQLDWHFHVKNSKKLTKFECDLCKKKTKTKVSNKYECDCSRKLGMSKMSRKYFLIFVFAVSAVFILARLGPTRSGSSAASSLCPNTTNQVFDNSFSKKQTFFTYFLFSHRYLCFKCNIPFFGIRTHALDH